VNVSLPPDLDRSLIALYRAWDRLERDKFSSSVIDFDLAEDRPAPTIASREDVREELEQLTARAGEASGPAAALVRGRLRASLAYLRALQNVDAIPFREYICETMGIEPKRQPEVVIQSSELRLGALLRDWSEHELHLATPITFSRKGFAAFRAESQTGAGANLKRQFEYFCGKWMKHLMNQIDARFDVSSIVVEFAEEDAYWKNWISGNVAEGEPITLRINVHERHVWYQGAVELLVLHEYCGHAVQMALWHEALRRGEIASFFGVLTVHFPDQFLLEGLAESVAYVLPGPSLKLEKRSKIIRELQRYNLLVLNNVHILANERGGDAARLYAKQRLPFTSEDTIERELRDRTRHPLFRTYQYVYAPAKEAFVSALAPLAHRPRWRLLQHLYRTPMTPDQVQELFATAAKRSRTDS
jgi:hypothetical protein